MFTPRALLNREPSGCSTGVKFEDYLAGALTYSTGGQPIYLELGLFISHKFIQKLRSPFPVGLLGHPYFLTLMFLKKVRYLLLLRFLNLIKIDSRIIYAIHISFR
jgi:hypothetical protein